MSLYKEKTITFDKAVEIPALNQKFYHLSTVLSVANCNNSKWNGLYGKDGYARDGYDKVLIDTSKVSLGRNGGLDTFYAQPAKVESMQVSGNTFTVLQTYTNDIIPIVFKWVYLGDFDVRLSVNSGSLSDTEYFSLNYSYKKAVAGEDIPRIQCINISNILYIKVYGYNGIISSTPISSIESIGILRQGNSIKLYYNTGGNDIVIYSTECTQPVYLGSHFYSLPTGFSLSYSFSGEAYAIASWLTNKYKVVDGGVFYNSSVYSFGVSDFSDDEVYIITSKDDSCGCISICNQDGDTIWYMAKNFIWASNIKFSYDSGVLSLIDNNNNIYILDFANDFSFTSRALITGVYQNKPHLYPFFLKYSSTLETDVINNSRINEINKDYLVNPAPTPSVKLGISTKDGITATAYTYDIGQYFLAAFRISRFGNVSYYSYQNSRNFMLSENTTSNSIIKKSIDETDIVLVNKLVSSKYPILKTVNESRFDNANFEFTYDVVSQSSYKYKIRPKNYQLKFSPYYVGIPCRVYDVPNGASFVTGSIIGYGSDSQGDYLIIQLSDQIPNGDVAIILAIYVQELESPLLSYYKITNINGIDVFEGANGFAMKKPNSNFIVVGPNTTDIIFNSDNTIKSSNDIIFDNINSEWIFPNTGSYYTRTRIFNIENSFSIEFSTNFGLDFSQNYINLLAYVTRNIDSGFIIKCKRGSGNNFDKIYFNSNGTDIEIGKVNKYINIKLFYSPNEYKLYINGNLVDIVLDKFPASMPGGGQQTYSFKPESIYIMCYQSSFKIRNVHYFASTYKHTVLNPQSSQPIGQNVYQVYPCKDGENIFMATDNGIFLFNLMSPYNIGEFTMGTPYYSMAIGRHMIANTTSGVLNEILYKIDYETFEDNPILLPPYETGFASDFEITDFGEDNKIYNIYDYLKRNLVAVDDIKVLTRAIVLKAFDEFPSLMNVYVPYDLIKKTELISLNTLTEEEIDDLWLIVINNLPKKIHSIIKKKIDIGYQLLKNEKLSTACALVFWRYCYFKENHE